MNMKDYVALDRAYKKAWELQKRAEAAERERDEWFATYEKAANHVAEKVERAEAAERNVDALRTALDDAYDYAQDVEDQLEQVRRILVAHPEPSPLRDAFACTGLTEEQS